MRLLTTLAACVLVALPAGIQAAKAEPLTALLKEADPGLGEALFSDAGCDSCHVADSTGGSKTGPNLWGIVKRPVASQAGFFYSPAMRSLGGTWDAERLDAFLSDPLAMIPRSKMRTPGIESAEDRAALIRFLMTRADEPLTVDEASATD